MYLTPKQLDEIKQPKVSGDRGLEREIYEQHSGDRQTHSLRNGVLSSYRYLNRPLPQANGLHLLYPEIDTGSVFLDSRKWDQEWEYSRDNIPPVEGEEAVSKYRQAIHAYNKSEKAEARKALEQERSTRRISDLAGLFLQPENSPIEIQPELRYETTIGDVDLITGKDDIIGESVRPTIENYVHIDPGYYGYARATPYAEMGNSCGYNTVAGQVTRLTENIRPGGKMIKYGNLRPLADPDAIPGMSMGNDNTQREPKRAPKMLSHAAQQPVQVYADVDLRPAFSVLIAIIAIGIVVGVVIKFKSK